MFAHLYSSRFQPDVRTDLFNKMCNEANVEPKLGVVGCGIMSRALLRGLLSSGLVPKSAVGVSDVSRAALQALQDSDTPAAFVTESTEQLIHMYADGIVLLAVKPDMLSEVAQQLSVVDRPLGLIVSILAGTTTKTVQQSVRC